MDYNSKERTKQKTIKSTEENKKRIYHKESKEDIEINNNH
jgi:hypothetical protein